jgi:hypothetical protein
VDNKNVMHPAKHGVPAFWFEYRRQGLLDHGALGKSLLSELRLGSTKLTMAYGARCARLSLTFIGTTGFRCARSTDLTLVEAMSQDHPELVRTFSPEIFIAKRCLHAIKVEYWVSQLEKAALGSGFAGNFVCDRKGCDKAFYRLVMLQTHRQRQ